jgi:hypothetical protein
VMALFAAEWGYRRDQLDAALHGSGRRAPHYGPERPDRTGEPTVPSTPFSPTIAGEARFNTD